VSIRKAKETEYNVSVNSYISSIKLYIYSTETIGCLHFYFLKI